MSRSAQPHITNTGDVSRSACASIPSEEGQWAAVTNAHLASALSRDPTSGFMNGFGIVAMLGYDRLRVFQRNPIFLCN